MVTLTLKPLKHRGAENIALCFASNASLNTIVKKIKTVQWSHSNKCWYLPLSKESYTAIVHAVGTAAAIDNSILKPYLQKRKKITAADISNSNAAAGHTINVNQQPNAAAKKITNPTATKAWRLCSDNLAALQQFTTQLKLKAYSPSTIRTYCNELLQLLQLLKNKPVESLMPADIKRYMLYAIEKECISENTAHSRLNALKFYFEQVLGREKFFFEIPRPKKPIKLPKVLSEEKIIAGLMAVENLKHKTILLLAYSAGLRVSEAVQLKITDINSDRMQISIQAAKGKKDRMVTLSKAILQLLRQYYTAYKPTHWLFEGQDKEEHYSSRAAQLIFKAAYKELRLPPQCSFHSLRHSYATHLLENGTDIAYIQKLLGHNDIKTTLRYTQVTNRDIGKIESPLDKLLRKRGM